MIFCYYGQRWIGIFRNFSASNPTRDGARNAADDRTERTRDDRSECGTRNRTGSGTDPSANGM